VEIKLEDGSYEWRATYGENVMCSHAIRGPMFL
jgi:hypothetical protein